MRASQDQRIFGAAPFQQLWEAVLRGPFGTKKYTIAALEQGITAVTTTVTPRKTELPRPIVQSCVQRARNTQRISLASPHDFVTAACDEAQSAALPLPYCLDLLRRRALYVCDADCAAAQAAPFYYLHLRQTARRLVSVPFERLSPVAVQRDPVFLFSPGRVGSTLISRVLAEAGVASVSEPDFYTQAARPLWQSPLNPWHQSVEAAMWHLSDDLGAALGAPPVVKLRAECAAYPRLFLRRSNAKTIVLLRDFESWSRSTAQVFGAGAGKAVSKYLAALRCYQTLRQRSDCHLMRYEDWVNDPNAAATALGRFLGVTIGPEAVQRAFGSHSQAGTPLMQRERPGWREKWQGALALWRSPRLVSARLTLKVPEFGP